MIYPFHSRVYIVTIGIVFLSLLAVLACIVIKDKIHRNRNYKKLEFSGKVNGIYRYERGLTHFCIGKDTVKFYGKGRDFDYAVNLGDSVSKKAGSVVIERYIWAEGEFQLRERIIL